MKKTQFKLSALFSFGIAIIFSSCSSEETAPRPNVGFSMIGENRPAPAEVEFTNASSNADSYEWDFDDGNTSTEENPTHVYEEPGNYSVTLTATNEEGKEFTSKRFTIYGELLSWTPSRISLIEGNWGSDLGKEAYAVLRHANDNVFDYSEDGQYMPREISFDVQSPFIITNFEKSMDLSLTNGSAKLELREYAGGNKVNPDEDPLLFSHTLEASDIVPDNNTDPYLSKVILEDEGVIIEVEYNEAE